jgi:hypothetical protein
MKTNGLFHRKARPRRRNPLGVEALEHRLVLAPTLPSPPPHAPSVIAAFPPSPCLSQVVSSFPPSPC